MRTLNIRSLNEKFLRYKKCQGDEEAMTRVLTEAQIPQEQKDEFEKLIRNFQPPTRRKQVWSSYHPALDFKMAAANDRD